MAYATAAGIPQGQLDPQSFWDTFKKYAPIVINAVSQLSANPQVAGMQGFAPQSAAPGFAPQSFAPQSFAPQSFAPMGAAPQGQGQLQAQSFWDSFIQYAPTVIGAIAALEASPQVAGLQGAQGFAPQSAGPAFAPQSYAPTAQGQLDPQSFWDTFKKYAPIVINAVSQLSANPQIAGMSGFAPQSATPGFAPMSAAPQGQLQTQSFWDSFIKYAPAVIGTIAALDASPQVAGLGGTQGQAAAAGFAPQSAGPSFAPQSASAAQNPDVTNLVSRIVPLVMSAMQTPQAAPNGVIH